MKEAENNTFQYELDENGNIITMVDNHPSPRSEMIITIAQIFQKLDRDERAIVKAFINTLG